MTRLYPPYGPEIVPALRAGMLLPQPDSPILGEGVPYAEVVQLTSPDQYIRPAGFEYGGNVVPEAAKLLDAWHKAAIGEADLYWIDPDLCRRAWKTEPKTGPVDVGAFLSRSRYGFCVLGDAIEVPTTFGTTPITAVSWGPVADIPWTVETILPDDTDQMTPSGPASRRPFRPGEERGEWWHLRAFTAGHAGTDAIMGVLAPTEPSLREEFDLPMRVAPDIGGPDHDLHGTPYWLWRALAIAFNLADAESNAGPVRIIGPRPASGEQSLMWGPRRAVELRTELAGRPMLDGRELPYAVTGLIDDECVLRPEGYTGPAEERYLSGRFRPEALETARLLEAWHRRAMRQAALYWFDTDLIRHAVRCEEQFGEIDTHEGMFVSRYGFALFETPVTYSTPDGTSVGLRAVSWGPAADCGFAPMWHERTGPRLVWADRVPDAAEIAASVHVRFWFDATEDISCPIYERTDMVIDTRGRVLPTHNPDKGMTPAARLLVLAFELAQHDTTGRSEETDVPPPLARSAKAAGVKAKTARAPVVSMRLRTSMRDRLKASGDFAEDPKVHAKRDPYRYVKVSWRVRDTVDPDTGRVVRKGGIRYRNPELLTTDPGDTVRTGTLR